MKTNKLLALSLFSLAALVACNTTNTSISKNSSSFSSESNSITGKDSKSNYESKSSFNYDVLGVIKAPGNKVSYYEGITKTNKVKEYNDYIKSVVNFSNTITEKFNNYYLEENKTNNYAISPISIYSALAMASTITKDKTQEELLNVLQTNKNDLANFYKYLFLLLEKEYKEFDDGEFTYKSHLSNSIWIDKSFPVNDNAINTLADDMYCYSIKQDFLNDIEKSNKNISDFIYNETNKFLNVDLNLNPLTVFVLLNCYYLKDVWKDTVNGLNYSEINYDFINRNGSKVSTPLIVKYDDAVRINKQVDYSSIYIEGAGRTKVHFIVPSKNKTIDEVFNKTTLDQVINANYYNKEDKTEYYTTTYFPEFEAKCDKNIANMLMDMGVNNLFKTPNTDFLPLTDKTDIGVTSVQHITKLKVDKRGVEGAAVTAIICESSSMPDPGIKKVYENFFVDKAFGYVITQADVPVFTGVVNGINKAQ